MRDTKVGEMVKKNKLVLLVVSTVLVLIVLAAIMSSGFLQQKLTVHGNAIKSNAKITTPSGGSLGGMAMSDGGSSGSSGSSGGSGGGSSGGSSSSSSQSQGVQTLGAPDPSFSNYWDNTGTILGAGIAQMNVSIAGTNGSVGITIGGVNYTVENNNWLTFNGGGNVDYGNNAQFSPATTGAISFAAIITPSTTSRTMSVISKSADGLGKAEYELQFDNAGNIAFYVYSYYNHPHCSVSVGPADGGSSPYVAGQSYFVYAEYINGTSCSLQVNQQDIVTVAAVTGDPAYLPPTQGPADLRLGQRNSTALPNDFYGSIDNFVFYNQSLNPIQINRMYNEWAMGKSIPVLSYHRIFNVQQYGEPQAQEIVNKTNFAAQMKFLHDNGYQTITYQQWYNWTMGIGTIPAKPIIIDFDDGWYSVYMNAKPVMDSYGYVGVVAAYIDAIYASNGGTLPNSEDVDSMNFAQLKTLSNAGWEIASHSYTHPLDMTVLTVAQRVHEFNDSKNLLQSNLNVAIKSFIYPFDNDTIVTDAECGTFYSMCSGYTSYPFHYYEAVGDEDFFLYRNTNKIYANGAPMGMRRAAISNDTSILDLKYWIDNSASQQINSNFDYSDSGSVAQDKSGNGNDGTITGVAWNNNLYSKQILLNPGVYNYFWWAYGTSDNLDLSSVRSYTIYPPYIVNVSLQITQPTTAVPISVVSGSNVSIYFNFLNSSYTDSKNITSGITINNVTVGGKLATILTNPIIKTSNTYGANRINTLASDSISQPPAWTDAWDGSNASQSCYSGMAALDGNYCTVSASGFFPAKNPWARINFTITEDPSTITSLEVTATARSSSSSSTKKVAFILANFATNQWVEFASRANSETTRTVTFTSGISDYVRNGQVVMLLEGANMVSGDSIGVNYASITVNATISNGRQFTYIPGKGWNVNVTVPNATNGLQDLFVNATWSSYYGYVANGIQPASLDYRTDTVNPDIRIVYPLNNINVSDKNLDVNYTVNDSNLAGCWYSNDSYSINTTIPCGVNITTIIWSNGQHNVTVWAKDVSNNVNSSTVRFTVDTIAPAVAITYPLNNINTSNKQIGVNYTVNETGTGINSCWYSNDSGKTNNTLVGCANIAGTTWTEGINNIVIWANDNVNNTGSANVSFRLDSTPPVFINLTNPSIYNNQSLNYDINANDSGVGLGTFAINSTTLFSIVPSTGVLTNVSGLAPGAYYINVSVNDTLGNMNSAILTVNVGVSLDVTPPYFTAIPPTTNIIYTQGFAADFNATDNRAFGTFAINWTTFFMIDSTGLLTNSTANIPAGNYYINVTINDTSNNLNSTIYNVNVGQAVPVLSLTGVSPIVYGTATNFTGSGCPSQLVCALNIPNGVYGAGTVTANYSTAGNSNYTAASSVFSIVVNQAVPVLTITGTSPLVYGISTDVAGAGCPSQLVCALDKINRVYGAGTTTFNYSTAGNSNYTAASATKDIVVNKASLNFLVTLTTPINSPAASDYHGTITNGEASCAPTLTRNGAVIANGFSVSDTSVLGVGLYVYNYSAVGCVNYTNAEDTRTLTVNLVSCHLDAECDDGNPHTQDICNNPGTPSSSCSHLPIACLANSECGTDAYLNSPTCQSDNVWQNFRTFTCNNAGTTGSYCSNSTSLKQKEACQYGCIDGRCKIQVCNIGGCYYV